jgi:hypothetical protein
MKRILFVLLFFTVFLNIFSNELIHAYYGDYTDIVRLVFVLRSEVPYNILLDSDNRQVFVNLNNVVIATNKLDLIFERHPLISNIEYIQNEQNTRINIHTNVMYYAETFSMIDQGNIFKIVIDIYRQAEPISVEAAYEYIRFYEIVGYNKRAEALRKRIAKNDFPEPVIYYETFVTEPIYTPQIITIPEIIEQPQEPLVITPEIAVVEQTIFNPSLNSLPPVPPEKFINENPLLYIKPDDVFLAESQRNWVNNAFRLYDYFKSLHHIIDDAEKTLMLYDTQKTVSISFIETMSRSYNSLSDVNINLNETKLNFNNLNDRINFPTNNSIEYTRIMIAHVLATIGSYQLQASRLQYEYDIRINR